MPRGSVVVVAHNSGGCIESCLDALCAEKGWEIFLVDNASADDTCERASRFGSCVRVVANLENRGFAGAVNQAARLSAATVIIAMNPDVVPEPGALEQLAAALAEDKAAAAGGMLLESSGQPQRGFLVRRFPTIGSALCEVLLVNRIWPSNPWNSRYRCLDLEYSRPQMVDQPAGAALAFRRDAWEQAGGLDENFYPVWFEDVDFCLRLRQLGWRILYWPQAKFRHGGGHSVRRLSFSERQTYWYGNLLRYFRKHHGKGSVALLRAGIAAGMVLRSLATLSVGSPESVSRGSALCAYGKVMWACALRGVLPERPAAAAPAGSSGLRS